jgi:PAS domain S-box-containing protein
MIHDRTPAHVRLLQIVAVAANEAASAPEALRIALEAVCEHTGWQLGHAYLREGDVFVPTGIWHPRAPATFVGFREETAGRTFLRGEGLVGRVAESTVPEWIDDLARPGAMLRHHAMEEGIRSGIAFPILVGREVAGVLEFFSASPVASDASLLEVMANVGTQLGRVIERERAEAALRHSEARFAGIISISADAIVSIDDEHRIIFFNQGAEQIFGYAPEEVLGERIEVLIPERFRSAHQAQVEGFAASEVAARRMGERGQISGRRRGGEVFPADASISKIEVGGHRIFTAVVRDVTERVRAEEALAAQAEELARSNADLEQFAYVASHDLQEPLRMVASYTQLLARRYSDRLDEDAREFIGYAVDGVTRMQALISDLLTYSRVGSRGTEVERVELDAVFADTMRLLAPSIEECGAVVTSDPLPTIDADPVLLGQVLQNLVGNAVKFRGAEPPRVHVSAGPSDDAWEISVRDNGIGIDPEYAQRIFVIFQRLHTRDRFSGTGIGLAICKKIVERLGGRIWVDPAPGGGSIFRFTLPFRTESE